MRRWGVFAILLGLLVGCSSPPPPTVVQVSVSATSDVNPTEAGQGAPLAVRIYQLGSDAAFGQAEFFQLFNQDQATLKTDLVNRQEFILAPGASRSMTLNPTDQVTAIGIFAAYRNFQGAKWRATAAVAPHQTTTITVQAGANGINVTTNPASALK